MFLLSIVLWAIVDCHKVDLIDTLLGLSWWLNAVCSGLESVSTSPTSAYANILFMSRLTVCMA